MSVTNIRRKLHQFIDSLADHHLRQLWQVAKPLYQQHQGTSLTSASTHDLTELIAKIQDAPSAPKSITQPTKSWAMYAKEAWHDDAAFDTNQWLQEWDAFEAQMKAIRLTHEQIEFQENW